MLATARSAIRLAPALRVDAHARARPVRVGYSPIRRRDLTLPTFARASLGDARGRRPISSPVVSSRPGSASASRRRASRRAAAEGDGAGDRDEDSGQSSVAEAETNAADDADSYNVAEEMPDTIPYKSRDSADEEDDDDDIELPSPGANAEAVKPAKGWKAKPEYAKPTPQAYFRGQAGYSKFYPPDARNYQYKRHLMVAVDGSKESEHAVEWTIGHLCRSGDLLHIVHVETAGDMDPRLNTPTSRAFPDAVDLSLMVDPEAQEQYWSNAVKRTEEMLDEVYDRLKATHGVRGWCGGSLAGELAGDGEDMTRFPQPVELDAVLDTTFEPVAEVVLKRAKDLEAEMLVVAHHSRNWWEKALVGSVAQYLIDRSDVNVVVLH